MENPPDDPPLTPPRIAIVIDNPSEEIPQTQTRRYRMPRYYGRRHRFGPHMLEAQEDLVCWMQLIIMVGCVIYTVDRLFESYGPGH